MQPCEKFRLERAHDSYPVFDAFMTYAIGKDIPKATAMMNHTRQQEPATMDAGGTFICLFSTLCGSMALVDGLFRCRAWSS